MPAVSKLNPVVGNSLWTTMTTKKGKITAEELQRQVDANPDYQKLMQEKEEKMRIFKAELEKDEEDLVKEIKQKGFDIDSVWDLINNTPHPFLERRFLGPYPEAYPILVDHLDSSHHPKTREGIVRALTVKDVRAIAMEKLLEHFYNETDKEVKWALANALRVVLTPAERKHIPEIKQTLKNGLA